MVFLNLLSGARGLLCLDCEGQRLRRTAQKHSRGELLDAQGQGRQPRAPGCDGTLVPRGSYPTSDIGAAAKTSYPTSDVRGSGQEEQPHIQGLAAAWAQEAQASYPMSDVRGGGGDELSHVRRQGRQPRGATPHSRSGGCVG